jgi:iron complex transport system substrate-binding protein
MSSHFPRRIACLQPSATVILESLGKLDRVVACTRYCADVLAPQAKRPRVILADSWNASSRQIIAAEPDLVIAAVPYQEKSVTEILKAGARFLGLAPKTLPDVYMDIATIAGVVDASERGQKLIARMQEQISDTRSKTSVLSRPRVFCEEWGRPIIASQPWVAELVDAAGGEIIGIPGAQICMEEVARQNPEVIIAAWCGAGDRVPLEKIIVSRGWQRTEAARNGRVYCISDELLNTPAPTLLRGLDALAYALHPENFPRPEGIRRITDISGFSSGELSRVS